VLGGTVSKETRAFLMGLPLPLVLAVAGWINAHAKHLEAEAQREAKYELSDSFQEYVEYVMEQKGCEP